MLDEYQKDVDDDDKISVQEDSPEETYITINDMNTVQEMNIAQLNINPETGEELPQ